MRENEGKASEGKMRVREMIGETEKKEENEGKAREGEKGKKVGETGEGEEWGKTEMIGEIRGKMGKGGNDRRDNGKK